MLMPGLEIKLIGVRRDERHNLQSQAKWLVKVLRIERYVRWNVSDKKETHTTQLRRWSASRAVLKTRRASRVISAAWV